MEKEKISLSQVEGIFGEEIDVNEPVILCKYQEHEGIVSNDGTIIVPFKYSSINGCVWDESGRLAVINDDELLGFVDKEGEEVIPCQFPFRLFGSEPFQFYEDRFPVLDSNGLIGFIDPSGKVVIPGQFHDVRKFQNGFCAVMNKKRKWGYVDRDGVMCTPYKYNEAYSVNQSGEAKVEYRILCFNMDRTIKLK